MVLLINFYGLRTLKSQLDKGHATIEERGQQNTKPSRPPRSVLALANTLPSPPPLFPLPLLSSSPSFVFSSLLLLPLVPSYLSLPLNLYIPFLLYFFSSFMTTPCSPPFPVSFYFLFSFSILF